jgi:hypothetical protein
MASPRKNFEEEVKSLEYVLNRNMVQRLQMTGARELAVYGITPENDPFWWWHGRMLRPAKDFVNCDDPFVSFLASDNAAAILTKDRRCALVYDGEGNYRHTLVGDKVLARRVGNDLWIAADKLYKNADPADQRRAEGIKDNIKEIYDIAGRPLYLTSNHELMWCGRAISYADELIQPPMTCQGRPLLATALRIRLAGDKEDAILFDVHRLQKYVQPRNEDMAINGVYVSPDQKTYAVLAPLAMYVRSVDEDKHGSSLNHVFKLPNEVFADDYCQQGRGSILHWYNNAPILMSGSQSNVVMCNGKTIVSWPLCPTDKETIERYALYKLISSGAHGVRVPMRSRHYTRHIEKVHPGDDDYEYYQQILLNGASESAEGTVDLPINSWMAISRGLYEVATQESFRDGLFVPRPLSGESVVVIDTQQRTVQLDWGQPNEDLIRGEDLEHGGPWSHYVTVNGKRKKVGFALLHLECDANRNVVKRRAIVAEDDRFTIHGEEGSETLEGKLYSYNQIPPVLFLRNGVCTVVQKGGSYELIYGSERIPVRGLDPEAYKAAHYSETVHIVWPDVLDLRDENLLDHTASTFKLHTGPAPRDSRLRETLASQLASAVKGSDAYEEVVSTIPEAVRELVEGNEQKTASDCVLRLRMKNGSHVPLYCKIDRNLQACRREKAVLDDIAGNHEVRPIFPRLSAYVEADAVGCIITTDIHAVQEDRDTLWYLRKRQDILKQLQGQEAFAKEYNRLTNHDRENVNDLIVAAYNLALIHTSLKHLASKPIFSWQKPFEISMDNICSRTSANEAVDFLGKIEWLAREMEQWERQNADLFIHGDAHKQNRWQHDGKISVLGDWGLARKGSAAFELSKIGFYSPEIARRIVIPVYCHCVEQLSQRAGNPLALNPHKLLLPTLAHTVVNEAKLAGHCAAAGLDRRAVMEHLKLAQQCNSVIQQNRHQLL